MLAARLSLVLLLAACGSRGRGAAGDDVRVVELAGIDTMPAMRISVPRLLVQTSLDGVDPPAIYLLMGGSLREGLLADVMIGPDPRAGTDPQPSALPRCTGRERTERHGDVDAVICDDDRGRRVAVVHEHPGGRVVCMASWRAARALDERETRTTRDVEAACLTLAFR